jgi:hypothetical protein
VSVARTDEALLCQLTTTTFQVMWDFHERTLGMLYKIDPALPLRTSREKEAWSDIVGRSVMGAGLLLDEKPGMLDMMVESTYPNQSGPRPVIGEDLLESARKLKG